MFVIVTHLGTIVVREGIQDIKVELKKAKEAKSRFIELTEEMGNKCLVNIEILGFCCKHVPTPGPTSLVKPPGSAGSA